MIYRSAISCIKSSLSHTDDDESKTAHAETDDITEAPPALVVEVIEPKARLIKEDEEGFQVRI